MNAPTPDHARFLTLLVDEVAQLRAFVDLLAREETLLLDGQTDALLLAADEKTQRYRALQRLGDERVRLLARLGQPATDEAIRGLCATDPDALAKWDAVLELARDAQARNARNGMLINERMQHNQAALTTLLSAADQPQLYDAAGQSRPTGSGRRLGSA